MEQRLKHLLSFDVADRPRMTFDEQGNPTVVMIETSRQLETAREYLEPMAWVLKQLETEEREGFALVDSQWVERALTSIRVALENCDVHAVSVG